MKLKRKTILIAGLIVGTIDILCAIVKFLIETGRNPQVIFKFIASGVFGVSALKGGIDMVVAGALFHYGIATIWAFLFFLLASKMNLKKHLYSIGALYGIFVWIMMNKVVLPLSSTPPLNKSITDDLIGIAILIAAIGLPLAFFYKRTSNN